MPSSCLSSTLLKPEGTIFVSSFCLLFCDCWLWHSSSALFQPVGAIIALSRGPVSPREKSVLHKSVAPVMTSGDLILPAASQGTCRSHLPLDARGSCIPGPPGTLIAPRQFLAD